jgi:hypothetical protein
MSKRYRPYAPGWFRFCETAGRGLSVASSALKDAIRGLEKIKCQDLTDDVISKALELLMAIKEESPIETIKQITDELQKVAHELELCVKGW